MIVLFLFIRTFCKRPSVLLFIAQRSINLCYSLPVHKFYKGKSIFKSFLSHLTSSITNPTLKSHQMASNEPSAISHTPFQAINMCKQIHFLCCHRDGNLTSWIPKEDCGRKLCSKAAYIPNKFQGNCNEHQSKTRREDSLQRERNKSFPC